jgi:hypothetical protein
VNSRFNQTKVATGKRSILRSRRETARARTARSAVLSAAVGTLFQPAGQGLQAGWQIAGLRTAPSGVNKASRATQATRRHVK